MPSFQDDSDLCREVYAALTARSVPEDAARMSVPERTVLVVGRFLQVLLDLEETAKALRRIDAYALATEFEANRSGRDSAIRVLTVQLAEYIRDHVQTLELSEPPMAEIVEAAAPAEPRVLPHWAGVAFAAWCASAVFPLLSRYWPKIPMERAARIRNAIEESAASAAAGEPRGELNVSVVEMLALANAALVGGSGVSPPDEHAAGLASAIIKSAEKAADAARSPPSQSAVATVEAFEFALQAVAETPELAKRLKRRHKLLSRTATREKWASDTPLSQERIEAIAHRNAKKRWWGR